MDRAHNDRIRDLCAQIETEKDPQKFISLVEELNRILCEGNTFSNPDTTRTGTL